MKKIKDELNPNKAVAFELQDDLPKLFNAIFGLNSTTPSYFDKVKLWSRILLQIAIFARSSDITTYFPDLKNVEFPYNTNQLMSDGVPRWIVIGFYNWKCRDSHHCKH